MADGCCQAAHKRWETMSGMILNRLHPKFAAKSVANEMQYLKAMLWPALTGQTSIFDFQFFQQSDFVDNQYVTDQPFIAWSWRSVLHFKFSVLTFSRLISCWMSIEQNLYWVKIFQLQFMWNAIGCINQRFVFKNSGISCLALIFNLKNLRTTILHAKKLLQVARIFFCSLICTHCSLVKVSHSESGDLGLIPAGCWNSLQPFCHFEWHWASQCTDTQAFILLCSLSLYSWISSVVILCWQGFNS